jgi:hypothetical protein
MATTYDKIASTTLGSAASTITFSSIASSWTDIKLILTGTSSTGGAVILRFNSDTGSNYSNTQLYGVFSAVYSGAQTSQTSGNLTVFGLDTTTPNFIEADIFSYAGSTYKTVLNTFSNDLISGTKGIAKVINLWRSTSAITRIDLILNGGNFSTGTIATIYGIKAA